MQGDQVILELLNEVLTGELTSVNQYFVHAKMCDNWGYERLAAKIRDESIDEMRHAEALVERILYLEGAPNLQRLGSVRVGETVVEQLELDLAQEREALERFNRGIALSREKGDNGSRALLEGMLTSEEEHVDWLESQLELVRQLGEGLYLSQQVRG